MSRVQGPGCHYLLTIVILIASCGWLVSQPAYASDPPDYECQPGQTVEENQWCCEGFDADDPATPEECRELPRTGPTFPVLLLVMATASLAFGVAVLERATITTRL